MADPIKIFGATPDGTPVERVTLKKGRLTARILSYGATVQDLRMEGFDHPLVLGAPTLEPYFGPMTYFGALVGRFANRIAHGRFTIDGNQHQVPVNWLDEHALHGGAVGAGQKVWSVHEVRDDRVHLGLSLADGEMGFPGALQVSALISLPGTDTLEIDIQAKTDAPTPCSFTHHGFFNLDGTADITAHELKINTDNYLPVDSELIPTGVVSSVAGTKFDFRTLSAIGAQGLDHNYCLSNAQAVIRPVAMLRSPANGLAMTIETTEPGLQVYDGGHMPREGLPGLATRTYGPYAGIALETQAWPDAPNQPDFPNAILRPGGTYHHRVRYTFQREQDP